LSNKASPIETSLKYKNLGKTATQSFPTTKCLHFTRYFIFDQYLGVTLLKWSLQMLLNDILETQTSFNQFLDLQTDYNFY
jgi:hypothetical protein